MIGATAQMELHSTGGLRHEVLFYDSDAEFRTAVADFAHEGVAAGEPVLVAAPEWRLNAIRDGLNESGDAVTFADAMGVGANPARLIPAYRHFIDAHPGRRLRLTGELVWPGRTAAEFAEITRHEALVNLAFADTPISIRCLYAASGIDAGLRANVERAHPVIIRDSTSHANDGYAGPGLSPFCDQPLSSPPADIALLDFTEENALLAARKHVCEHAARFGLPDARTEDLVLAVNELVSNAVLHGGGRGVVRLWHDAASGAVTCEVDGPGQITDPLAGRRFDPASTGGQGLWLVNQICDLVELRSHSTGTTIRVHMRLQDPLGAVDNR